jgi:hypothetical protein
LAPANRNRPDWWITVLANSPRMRLCVLHKMNGFEKALSAKSIRCTSARGRFGEGQPLNVCERERPVGDSDPRKICAVLSLELPNERPQNA